MNVMMNDLRKLFAALFITFGLLMGSCGEDVDPNMADVKLTMKATSNLGSLNASSRVMDDHINFTAALLGVTEIEFESIVDDDSDDDNSSSDDDSDDDSLIGDRDDFDDSDFDIEFEGRFVVDLIEGTSTPDFGISDVIPGVYEEIEVKMEPILEDGNSIYIEFTYQETPDSEPVTIQYSTNKEIEFEIERESGIQMDGGMLNQILVIFDLDQFLNEININETSADMDGIVRINSNSNADIAAAIWSKLHLMMKAGEDHDGDDDFDDDHDDD
jgi:hypothetical protein